MIQLETRSGTRVLQLFHTKLSRANLLLLRGLLVIALFQYKKDATAAESLLHLQTLKPGPDKLKPGCLIVVKYVNSDQICGTVVVWNYSKMNI